MHGRTRERPNTRTGERPFAPLDSLHMCTYTAFNTRTPVEANGRTTDQVNARTACNEYNSRRKYYLTTSYFSIYYGSMKSFLSASEVAKLINVDRATVSRWIKKGLVKGVIRPEGSQQWRIPISSYQKLVKHHEGR